MQLKSKLFRLRAKKNTIAVKSILRFTIDCLYRKEKVDSLINSFLNVSEDFLNEFPESEGSFSDEDKETIGFIIRENIYWVQALSFFK